jgi:hypothetical protein
MSKLTVQSLNSGLVAFGVKLSNEITTKIGHTLSISNLGTILMCLLINSIF